MVIQIRTTGIQFCTSVKEFGTYIIQIKMPVESIQISNLAGKRISSIQIRTWAFEYVMFSFKFAYAFYLIDVYSN